MLLREGVFSSTVLVATAISSRYWCFMSLGEVGNFPKLTKSLLLQENQRGGKFLSGEARPRQHFLNNFGIPSQNDVIFITVLTFWHVLKIFENIFQSY